MRGQWMSFLRTPVARNRQIRPYERVPGGAPLFLGQGDVLHPASTRASSWRSSSRYSRNGGATELGTISRLSTPRDSQLDDGPSRGRFHQVCQEASRIAGFRRRFPRMVGFQFAGVHSCTFCVRAAVEISRRFIRNRQTRNAVRSSSFPGVPASACSSGVHVEFVDQQSRLPRVRAPFSRIRARHAAEFG